MRVTSAIDDGWWFPLMSADSFYGPFPQIVVYNLIVGCFSDDNNQTIV